MRKLVLYSMISIFSALGSWIPSLWGAGFISASGIIGGIIGCFVGIFVYFKIQNYTDY